MLAPNFNPFPELSTSRLHLRKVTPDDSAEMFFMRSDERVMKYIDKEPAKSIADALDFITLINDQEANNDSITWAITLKESPKLIGTICIWNLKKQHYRGEIGYSIHPDFQRKGYMQEAMEAVLHYGFYKMNLHSIEANINPDNRASALLLEKNGFVKEAHFKEDYFFNGKFIDTIIYSLLKANFKK